VCNAVVLRKRDQDLRCWTDTGVGTKAMRTFQDGGRVDTMGRVDGVGDGGTTGATGAIGSIGSRPLKR
jgi:hypothetical protein